MAETRLRLAFDSLRDKPQMDTQGATFIHREAVTDKHMWTAKLLDVQSDTVSFEVSFYLLLYDKKAVASDFVIAV
ncbi:hypothetical protein RR48_08747 [Papilio machaon]|uniref:Uncharacterized protein n=1 Tax=Papilio machaon TaxID=76193 RepID=A0A194RMN0_PAPMA|nr:hypothetical protein RR48_08747 [Papilio machaon]